MFDSLEWLQDIDEDVNFYHLYGKDWSRDQGVQTNISHQTNENNFNQREVPHFCNQGHETQGFIVIDVIDSGIGITIEDSARLFKPFAQANSQIQGKFGGTGLGLWLSQKIIKLFNGDITIQSRANEGSTFTISFPVQVAQGAKYHQQETDIFDQIKEKLRGSTVVIVEDLAYNQTVIAEIVRSLDCEVQILSDGSELVEFYQQNNSNFEAILLDIDMPVMDGIVATELIREYEKHNNLDEKPIIILTGNATE